MDIRIFPSAESASHSLARRIARLIDFKRSEGKAAVLGLATGKSPLFLYAELVRMHREEGLSFGNVVTFNLDEYHGIGREDPRSYWSFMHRSLFDLVDIPPENVHMPEGMIFREEIDAFCHGYEEKIRTAGGIDLQILGIGRTGHIGFNEPGAGRDSRTNLVRLDELTRSDASREFGGMENVPLNAITMGCGTILEARSIALMAWGEGKADVVAAAFGGEVSDRVPASYLQEHPAAAVYLDERAAILVGRGSRGKESCFEG